VKQIDYDDLKNQTTHEIKKLLTSLDGSSFDGSTLDGSFENINPIICICMSLCDRIAHLEEQVQKIKPEKTNEPVKTSETEKKEIVKLNTQEQTITLREQIQEASRIAEEQDTSGDFNPMSWLDLELENNPESFDGCFDRAWDELPETEQAQRSNAIRKVL